MNVNEVYYGFKLIREKYIDDIGAKMFEFKHLKSGANLVYLANDDTNKCFAMGFRTLPENSTGVCHIIEHSLLCGSEKYPLKEPFVNLLKGSMSTFLNAFTAQDWTMYPVASQNDKDFDNLVKVYIDACLAPLSIKDPKPFLQEGWHLELTDKDSLPQYKGVVYNEMIGATSSVDEQLSEATLVALYEGTGYGVNSGGDPDVIPTLTYDYYKNFYKEHYHPANAMMYLYGKMDVLEKLKFFDEEYLSKYEYSEGTTIDMPKKLINTDYSKDYAISEDEELEDNTYYSIAFGLDKYENMLDFNAMGILNDALMGTNDSPLKKKLLDSKLFQEVYASLDDDCILPNITFSFNKSNSGLKDEIYNLLIKSLKEVLAEGIDKDILLSTINIAEFKNKEMDMGRMPKGLFFAIPMMQAFNYKLPYECCLEYSKYFDYYKKEINNGYFESLIEKYLLNSDHYAIVTLNPSKTLTKEKEELMMQKMKEIKASLSDEEVNALVKQTEDLIAYQSKQDTQEELDTLPKLTIADLNSNVNTLTTEEKDINGVKYLIHKFNTNGIGYLKYYFDFSCLTLEECRYLRILTRLLGSVDTEKYQANELQTYIKMNLGGLGASSKAIGINAKEEKTYFVVVTSALDENINKMTEALNQVMFHTIFDPEKIKITVLQMQNSLRNNIIEAGNQVAANEARACISADGVLAAEMTGIKMYRFISKVVEDSNYEEIALKLKELCNKIFNKNALVASISGSEKAIQEMINVTESLEMPSFEFKHTLELPLRERKNRALIIPSGVSYNAKFINLGEINEKYSGNLLVLNHIANYDYLWPEIRVKGGAYGASMGVRLCSDLGMTTYRDPNVKNSYKAFDNLCCYLHDFNESEEGFITYLIGAVGAYDQPESNNSMIISEDSNYLTGLTEEIRRNRKQEMIDTKISDIKDLARIFEWLKDNAVCFTVGSEEAIKEASIFEEIEKL